MAARHPVAGAGSSVGPSNKKQRRSGIPKPMGKGDGGKGKQRRPAMDDQVLASIARLTLQGAQASLLDTFLLPTCSQTHHFNEAGGTRVPRRCSERVGRPTLRDGLPTRAHFSCHGRITGDADAATNPPTRPAHDSEPTGTVMEAAVTAARVSRTRREEVTRFSIPSTGRSRSVGSQSWVVHHRSKTHGGHRAAEPSRADPGTSSQRSSGHGNMNLLTRCLSVGPPPVHSLPVSAAHDDHIGDTNNGGRSVFSLLQLRVWNLGPHGHLSV